MQIFAAVAETGGFAAAARKLGISPPVVTRGIAELEDRIQVKLFNRTTRHVRLTEPGYTYLDDVKLILENVAEADEAVAGINGQAIGRLTVTSSVIFGQKHVLPGIVEYLSANPSVKVSALFLDRVVNLLEEGVDVGVRIGNLPDSSFRAIRVGSVKRILCASPDYLKRHGCPEKPEDLKNHTTILASSTNVNADWKFNNDISQFVEPRLNVTTNEAAIQAAISGFGISRPMSYQVDEYLADNTLQRVLGDYESEFLPVNVIHREGRFATAKVRSFVDLMVDRLRSTKSLN